jgi:hypothetical protein
MLGKGVKSMKPRPIYLQLQREGKRGMIRIGWLNPDGSVDLNKELLLSYSLILEVNQ